MKTLILYNLLLFCLIFIPTQKLLGQIENISYEYAEIYYFNTDFPLKERPQHHLMQNGVYATSKIGNGKKVDNDFIVELNEILSAGVDGLYTGLSKTFVPKTGLVFFDSLDRPVASLSICTDCEGLRWWPENIIEAKRVKKINIKKAEGQIKELKNLLMKEILVFDRQEDFHHFADTSSTLKNTSEITINKNMGEPLLNEKVLEKDITNWMIAGEKLQIDTTIKITHGGDEFLFKELVSDTRQSKFMFSDVGDDSYLTDATILDPFVQFPNGIQIGMSQNHFFNQLGVSYELTEGVYPKKVKVTDEFNRYEFGFEKSTLRSIKFW